jgi:RNA-binding protein NOB1
MEASLDHIENIDVETRRVDIASAESDHLEISSQIHESVDASYSDGNDSEQSWMVRSLSESSVACVTSDFAMQNVLLQMGLRLLAPGGNQIRQLHRYAIVVHVCIGFPIIFYFLDWIIVVIFLSLKTSALAGGY